MDEVQVLQDGWSSCGRCRLAEERTNVVEGTGSHQPSLLLIGEAPGADEDEEGRPFCGKAGWTLLGELLLYVTVDDRLRAMALNSKVEIGAEQIEKIRESFEEDVFFDNIVACRPPGNRDPNLDEVAHCRERINKLIYLLDPLVIVAVGKAVLTALTGKKRSIMQDRGKLFWTKIPGRLCPEVTYPVIPILHPSFLDRQPDFGVANGWADRTQKDLLRAFRIADILREKYYGTTIPDRQDLSMQRR